MSWIRIHRRENAAVGEITTYEIWGDDTRNTFLGIAFPRQMSVSGWTYKCGLTRIEKADFDSFNSMALHVQREWDDYLQLYHRVSGEI